MNMMRDPAAPELSDPEIRAATTTVEGELLPPPKQRNRLRGHEAPRCYSLRSLTGLRREMGRVYKRMRNGDIATTEGTRLIYALSQIGKLVEIIDIEKRLDELERLANANRLR